MTREEAIKTIMSATVWTDEEREALATLIPELAESEDERILRVISEAVITFFSDYANDFEDEDRDAALAWLEKHKEPENTSASTMAPSCWADEPSLQKEQEPISIPTIPTYPANWGCDGTHCTNPQMDCINCPRKTTGGSFSTSLASGSVDG